MILQSFFSIAVVDIHIHSDTDWLKDGDSFPWSHTQVCTP